MKLQNLVGFMEWTVGQKVVCDRPEQLLMGCTIKANEEGSVIISCPNIDLVFWGRQEKLEQLGWRLDAPSVQSESL